MAWLQESLILHDIRLGAVRTDDNTADIGTKTLSQIRLAFLSRKLGLEDVTEEQRVLMIALTSEPEDQEALPWLWYLFLASLAMNALTVAWHTLCTRRQLQAPIPLRTRTSTTGTQTNPPVLEVGAGQALREPVRTDKVFVTRTGEHWHVRSRCNGLGNSSSTRSLSPCGHCCRSE